MKHDDETKVRVAPLPRESVMRSWYMASLVRRWHTWPTIQHETVGQHSHGVAMLWYRLFHVSSLDTAPVIKWILENDLAELWTGDAPYPVKVRFPPVGAALRDVEVTANAALGVIKPDLPLHVQRRIKVCDLLQAYLFGLHELRLGNSYALPIVRGMLNAAIQVAAGDDELVKTINAFVEENHD